MTPLVRFGCVDETKMTREVDHSRLIRSNLSRMRAFLSVRLSLSSCQANIEFDDIIHERSRENENTTHQRRS